MSAYVVTYDLNREKVRPGIVDAIKKIWTGWARLSESSYAVSYPGTPEQIYQKLKPMLDDDDFFYVIGLKKPYTGFGRKDVNEWVEKNLSHW